MVVQFRAGLESRLGKADNLSVIPAHTRLEGRDASGFRLRVGDKVVSSELIVLDTGTRSVVPPIEGLESACCIDAGNWLEMPHLPERLVIIGGGCIGLEMAHG